VPENKKAKVKELHAHLQQNFGRQNAQLQATQLKGYVSGQK
jgi:hypothetical protein